MELILPVKSFMKKAPGIYRIFKRPLPIEELRTDLNHHVFDFLTLVENRPQDN
jgi:hypothetical protein